MPARESTGKFSLGKEGSSGRFERQESAFRHRIEGPEAGRYHLYVCYACPWAHRTVIGRRLKGLEDVISMSAVDPICDDRGWGFTGGEYVDPLYRFRFLSEAYRATDPSFDGRYSVPVLWDKKEQRIVNNESGEILRMLNEDFGDLAEGRVDLYPVELRADIDDLNARMYDQLNNGVYKAGFSTEQSVYEEEVRGVFAMLDELDDRLSDGRDFLFGDTPVETDWRAFTTLIRFDAVYHIHFKCSLGRVAEYPHLAPYLQRLYEQPGIADTVRMDEIRAHYYGTHPMINPSGLIALEPRSVPSRLAQTA